MNGELREFAEGLISATTLEAKLASASVALTDARPGAPTRHSAPGRPSGLVPVSRAPRVPPLTGMPDPAQRARILHAFANHELQAVEIFAWALLAFPEAPSAFRRGLVGLITDEQRHLRAYMRRLDALGTPFGSIPVNAYFWGKLDALRTPLAFVASFCLVFENANLDHSLDHAAAARAAGDEATAAMLDEVFEDEKRHVAFGLRWLRALKPTGASDLATWTSELQWPLRPALARGPRFHPEARAGLGMDAQFLATLAAPDSTDASAPCDAPANAPANAPDLAS